MTEIVEDAFDIVQRIKSIDDKYKVYRNHAKHRFEVHKIYGLNEKLEVVWQGALDERLLRKVYMTRKENAEKLLKQMEIDNTKLKQEENNQLFNKIMENVEI